MKLSVRLNGIWCNGNLIAIHPDNIGIIANVAGQNYYVLNCDFGLIW